MANKVVTLRQNQYMTTREIADEPSISEWCEVIIKHLRSQVGIIIKLLTGI